MEITKDELYTRVLLAVGPCPGPISRIPTVDEVAKRVAWHEEVRELLGITPMSLGRQVREKTWVEFWTWYCDQEKQHGDSKG